LAFAQVWRTIYSLILWSSGCHAFSQALLGTTSEHGRDACIECWLTWLELMATCTLCVWGIWCPLVICNVLGMKDPGEYGWRTQHAILRPCKPCSGLGNIKGLIGPAGKGAIKPYLGSPQAQQQNVCVHLLCGLRLLLEAP
jgi:hypothetical protein